MGGRAAIYTLRLLTPKIQNEQLHHRRRRLVRRKPRSAAASFARSITSYEGDVRSPADTSACTAWDRRPVRLGSYHELLV
ncbi:hypothetical protein EVAR_22959_1 [Eumeta japonica]|uniref:Uncharacterized protein n=1 Tax=Eumeta variegata TaxID=151549 RepID=A0A4C1UR91_EUMVA|nr:hypothetical protein EVAR_22959_1 [Eumeta japonica]